MAGTEAPPVHICLPPMQGRMDHNARDMELDANDLLLFSLVVEAGSFSRAAEKLGAPVSTVSRRISALEERFGERLLHRSTRRLMITEFGVGVLEHARALAAEVEGAMALAQHRQAEPSGRLRVSLPADFATITLPEMLSRFAREHPAIVLDLDLSPRRVDLIGEKYDLAVRIGDLSDDPQLVARKLADLAAGLYASPSYLREVGAPVDPDDLLDLHGLLFPSRAGDGRGWVLERGVGKDRRQWKGTPRRYTVANSPSVLLAMAQAGYGVVSLPRILAQAPVAEGALALVLPDWNPAPGPCWAVFPSRRLMPARTRAFLEALVAAMDEWAVRSTG